VPELRDGDDELWVTVHDLLGHWGWFGCPQTAGLGVTEPPLGQTGWPATLFGFFFFFRIFFFKKKCNGGILEKKKKKKKKKKGPNGVKLPQFESLGGLRVTF
jgi:hypothetical protein